MVLCSNAEDEDCYFIVTVCSSTELIPQQDSASLLAWELLKMLPPTTVRDVDISIWGELPILLLLFLVSKATLIFLSYMAMPSLSLSLSFPLSLCAVPSCLSKRTATTEPRLFNWLCPAKEDLSICEHGHEMQRGLC